MIASGYQHYTLNRSVDYERVILLSRCFDTCTWNIFGKQQTLLYGREEIRARVAFV